MKKSKKEAAETRKRIVETAAAEFRQHGIEGIGLADLMASAGLTHGGFYKHFQSKEQLVEEALAVASTSTVQEMNEVLSGAPGLRGLHEMIGWYLSSEHRDNAACGCPLAALGSEMARSGEGVRETTTAGFLKMVDGIASHLEGHSPAAAKKVAIFIASTMIGAVTMARIVNDPELSATILREAKKRLTQLA
jgi:TetR/AcrR family transcriptional repressor of nem operon